MALHQDQWSDGFWIDWHHERPGISVEEGEDLDIRIVNMVNLIGLLVAYG